PASGQRFLRCVPSRKAPVTPAGVALEAYLAFRVASRILPGVDWAGTFEREVARYRDGEARLGDNSEERQRQLTRMGNAAWGAALSLLMQGEDAGEWLHRAAERWRESYAEAPPGSWGRPIGAIKALVLAGDWSGAEEAARWALAEGAGEAESPIGRYAAALACAVLADWEGARTHADAIRIRDDFPRDV